MVREHFLPAVIALVDVAPKERRTASGNILKRPFPIGVQRVSVLLAVRRAVEADDIGHFHHEDPALEVFHEFIQRMHHRIARFLGEMGVDLSGACAAVSEVLLNDAEIHAHF